MAEVAAFAGGDLAGAFPSAVVAGRLLGVDVLHEGSGNPGASNVARLAGLLPAAGVFAADAAKTLAAVLVAGMWGEWAAVCAGIGVVVGHAWPPWPGLRGGRGLGEILIAGLAVATVPTLVMVGFLAAGVFTGGLGVAALAGMAVYPGAAALWSDAPGVVFASVALALTVARRLQGSPHRSGASLREAWWQRLVFDREPPG